MNLIAKLKTKSVFSVISVKLLEIYLNEIKEEEE
jgi:hypothetical protein